ncbi:MAG: AEC family transporter [Trueperaceae bacterium]|nr:AEC family transporter [Trueperaceae bacterium]
MIDVLLQVVVPAFLVVGVGALLGRTLAPDLLSVNRLALYAAVPALVFASLSSTGVTFENAGLLLAGNALFLVGMGLLAWTVSWRVERSSRRGLLATSLFGNAANIMLPVSLFAFGEEGLQRALILYVFSAVTLFTLGPVVLGGGVGLDRRRFLGTLARLPVLWAAIAGVLVNALGLSVPLGLARGVALLGDAAIPLVLLTLGLQVARTGWRLPSGVNVAGAALKLGVAPLVGYAAGLAVGARGLDLAVLTLLAAMPPAVNIFMLALEFGADAEEVAATVVLSTFAAIGSLTLVIVALRLVVL